MALAERIREGCAALSLSQAGLARLVGLTPQNLQKIIDGGVARSKHLPAIARGLKCEVEWLTLARGEAPTWARNSSSGEDQEPAPVTVPPTWEQMRNEINLGLAAENARLRRMLVAAGILPTAGTPA